jgi:hypothetical protein
MFSFISKNWRGKPLVNIEVIASPIRPHGGGWPENLVRRRQGLLPNRTEGHG